VFSDGSRTLPLLAQGSRSVLVFSEGWGLYAEQLAGEAGPYAADDRGLPAWLNHQDCEPAARLHERSAPS
jgi:uncharacterized protein (DUF885 family)